MTWQSGKRYAYEGMAYCERCAKLIREELTSRTTVRDWMIIEEPDMPKPYIECGDASNSEGAFLYSHADVEQLIVDLRAAAKRVFG